MAVKMPQEPHNKFGDIQTIIVVLPRNFVNTKEFPKNAKELIGLEMKVWVKLPEITKIHFKM
jgi:hypothetical protein